MSVFEQMRKGEAGFVLLTTLILLAVGSLVIAATLGYTDTALRAKISAVRHTRGVYASEAGVEDVLSALKQGFSPRTGLPQLLNSNNVTMITENLGERSFYAGDWVTASSHGNWLEVAGSAVWDDTENAYKYTVNITWNAPSPTTIHLLEVGVQLPGGYTYAADSAASFETNLSQGAPDEKTANGAHLLNWVLGTPRPEVTEDDPQRSQSFYITGTGPVNGHYAWVVAARQDIGYVSEVTGIFYKITSTARSQDAGQVSEKIEADVLLSMGNIYILCWKINPG